MLVKNNDKVDKLFTSPAGIKPQDYLLDLNCCSQKGLTERFDSTIGGNTVLMPLGGKNQLTPACGMAAKIPSLNGESTTSNAYGVRL